MKEEEKKEKKKKKEMIASTLIVYPYTTEVAGQPKCQTT